MDALDPTSGEIEVYFAFLAYLCHRGFRSSSWEGRCWSHRPVVGPYNFSGLRRMNRTNGGQTRSVIDVWSASRMIGKAA
jgi:hypothetical protein